MKDVIFKASSKEGFLFKSLIELFCASFKRLVLSITHEGIFSRMTNSQEAALFDLVLHRENFTEFYIEEDLFFAFNIPYMQKITSSMKKKDFIQLEIYRNEPDKLHITVIPKERDYVDRGVVTLEKVQTIDISLPDGYDHPIQGCYSKFSKMWKELSAVSKDIRVHGNSTYVVFEAMIEGILGKGTGYGTHDPLVEDEVDAKFRVEDFTKLIKLSSFNSTIYFSVKRDLPFKLKVNVGALGTLTIFIRDQDSILRDMAVGEDGEFEIASN
jgi:hypothetical protein